eukprot:TRINITY_DN10077_c0_g1_i2.p1 TRINITY_DN10077_c0_g1~~TRINITY_DN10077_c0_g1_i2.p1  ORF type:complete len:316 (-),score=115.70 TRINITY_DN10077_c0_g1_i2:200-1147(-)
MDVEYLKQTVGDALAAGMAELTTVQPPDAIEFLGNWLMKNNDVEARKRTRAEEAKELAKQKEIYDKKHKEAFEKWTVEETARIKREKEERERMEQEAQAREIAGMFEEDAIEQRKKKRAEELAEEERQLYEGTSDWQLDDAKEGLEKAKNTLANNIDKARIAEIKKYREPPYGIYRILKACAYILNFKKKDVDTWQRCRSLVGSDFFKKMQDYDPEKKQRKLKFRRVAAAMRGLKVDRVNEASRSGGALYDWVVASVEARKQFCGLRKRQANNGFVDEDIAEDGASSDSDQEIVQEYNTEDEPEEEEEEDESEED